MRHNIIVADNKWEGYEEASIIDAIQGQASKLELPERYKVIISAPHATIFDTLTKQRITVGLCDYRGFVKGIMFTGM